MPYITDDMEAWGNPRIADNCEVWYRLQNQPRVYIVLSALATVNATLGTFLRRAMIGRPFTAPANRGVIGFSEYLLDDIESWASVRIGDDIENWVSVRIGDDIENWV